MSKSVARFSDRLPTKMGPLRQWLALDRHCYGSLTLIDCSQVRYSTRRRLWRSVVPEHIIPEGTTACLCRRLENETKRNEKKGERNNNKTTARKPALCAHTQKWKPQESSTVHSKGATRTLKALSEKASKQPNKTRNAYIQQ